MQARWLRPLVLRHSTQLEGSGRSRESPPEVGTLVGTLVGTDGSRSHPLLAAATPKPPGAPVDDAPDIIHEYWTPAIHFSW